MTNLPPSVPPWSQTAQPTGEAPQPTLGAPSQPTAFSNPVAGTATSSPGGIPQSVQSLFPQTPANRRPLNEAPIPVLAAVAAVIGQAVFTMVSAVFVAMAGGVAGALRELESSFGGSSGTSEGEFLLVAASMALFVLVVSFIMVALKLYGGSWKAWFGALAIQGFYLLVGLYMVIAASGVWVIGLIGPMAIAGILMLPDVRTWVATETNRS